MTFWGESLECVCFKRFFSLDISFSSLPSTVLSLLLVICSVFLLCPRSFAQTESATLSGTVSDAAGAVIADAEVRIVNVDTNMESTAKTNSSGIYFVPGLKPGNYRVFVSKPGFKAVSLSGLTLNVQSIVDRNFSLQVGSVSEVVTVTGGAPLVDTESAAVSTVVDRLFVENMPLNGRSFQSLIELTPGVVQTKGYAMTVGQFSVNGQRTDANYFSVDGVSANFGVNQGGNMNLGSDGGGTMSAASAGGGTNNLVSVDAMQEFKIQTSTFAPEFGRTPGAQVSIVTRSGANQFHGTAFEYFRNDILDATDWFTNYNKLPKPAERQNDFGGVFGGPILKNRLFFFYSYEGLRLRQPESRTTVVPSTAARSQAPAGMQPTLNAFPKPNISDGPLTGVFAASFSNPSTLDANSIRIDYAPTNKINLFGRYDHAPSSTSGRGMFEVFALSTVQHTISNVDTFTGGATVTFKPNLLNEFRFNISRATGGTGDTVDNFGGAVVPTDSYMFSGYPQGNSKVDVYEAIFLPGYYFFDSAQGTTKRQRQLNFVDTVSWTLGSHSIKAGFDYRRLTPINQLVPYQIYSLFAGPFSSTTYLSYVFSYGAGSVRPLFQNLSFFAQDTWKATANLTLTYGLRWEYNPPTSETSGHPLFTATNLNDPANAALAPPGTPLWSATHDNFAPRLGIAYRLGKTPGRELVVRAGAGIFYDLGNSHGGAGTRAFPYSQSRLTFNAPYPLSTADGGPVPFTLNPPYGDVTAFDPHLKLPRTYQWNVSVQQSLGSNQSVSATYLGAAGRKLLRDEYLDSVEGLNPNFSSIEVTTNDAYSNYNALQLQYQRRLSHGLQVLTSYAWAHALDNTSMAGAPAPYYTIYSPRLDYGNSDADVRHSISAAITYNVPSPGNSWLLRTIASNWSLDSLFRANTALPADVLTGLDPWNLGGSAYGGGLDQYDRPDVVANQPFYLYGSQYPGGKAFNPAAFQNHSASETQGNLARNALRGFGAWEEDLAIRREFPIYEQVKLQFRAELFNIFNHPNFGDPGSQGTGTNMLVNALFGLSTTTLAQSLYTPTGTGGFSPLYQIGGPRSIQLALKLIF